MEAAKLEGAPPAVIERVMLEAIARAIEFARDEDGGSLGVEVTPIDGRMPQPPSLMPDADPASYPKRGIEPVPTPEPHRMILLPQDEGFNSVAANKPTVGVDEPLNLWRDPAPDEMSSQEYHVKWQEAIGKLIGLVERNLPAAFQVVPDGTDLAIRIERINVQSDVPGGTVKALYGIRGQTQPTASTSGAITPMNIDRVVPVMLSIRDKSVNWEQRFQDLQILAQDVFRPRPKELVNRTPAPRADLLSLQNAGAYAVESNRSDQNAIEFDSARAARSQQPAGMSDAEVLEYLKWKQSRVRGPIVPAL